MQQLMEILIKSNKTVNGIKMTLNEVRRPVSETVGVWEKKNWSKGREEKKKSITFPSSRKKKKKRSAAEWNSNGL